MIGLEATAQFLRGTGKKNVARLATVIALAVAGQTAHIGFHAHSTMAQAQASASFSRIDVAGNQRIASDTVRTIAGIPARTRVSPAQVNTAVQNLYESGLFETVEVRPEGGRLVIEVTEYPTINEISIEGNRRLKDEDLIGLIGSVPRRAYSPAQAEADTQSIADAYAAQGRLAARVSPKIIRRSDNRVDLIFEVREGRVVEVNRIGFTGNRQYSDRRLRRAIDTKQAGIFRTLVRRDTYIADRIEFDKEKLRNFYLKRGYIDADVLSSSADFARERNAFGVNFQVQEGQQYTFGELTITTLESDVNVDEYAKALRIRSGRVYNPELVNTTIERLDFIAAQKGIPFLQASPRVTRNDDELTLDIEFELARGQRIFVERIDIEGNSQTLDRVIRREFDLIEGDPFNRRKVQAATDRLRALGYFSRVDVETREGSAPDQVVIDVNVEEKPTGTLSFGVGYGTDDGLNGNVGLTEDNFLGRGQQIALSISTTSENRDLSFSFTEPKLFDRDLLAGFRIFYRTTDNDEISFNTKRIGFSPRIRFPVGEYSRLELSYLLQSDEVIAEAGASPLIQVDDDGSQITSAIGIGYEYDRRNSPVDPTAGFIFKFDQTFAGLGGDRRYYKAVANAKSYTSLFNEEVVLSAEIEGGFLKSSGGDSRITERFQLGGNTLRGFESFGLGPRDVSADGGGGFYDDALGGNFYALARLEASFPIGLPEEYGVYGGLFFDMGSVWGLDTPGAASSADFDLRTAVGVSIFWDTALGPLRFNFAKPIRYVQGVDRTERFNFTIDTRF